MGEDRRIDRQSGLRLTLDEIERLLAIAARTGAPVEPWVEQLAAELRAALAGPGRGRRRAGRPDALQPARFAGRAGASRSARDQSAEKLIFAALKR